MSLVKQFKTLTADENKDDIQVLIDGLQLESSVETGFILSKKQFAHLSDILYRYTLPGQGLWKLQFHPKSGHVIHEKSFGDVSVYPTRGLSLNFQYFRWIFNGLFCADWNSFNCEIADIHCKYILFKQNEDGDYFCAYDLHKNIRHVMKTHVGGGRLYNEPSALPYKIHDTDTVVE